MTYIEYSDTSIKENIQDKIKENGAGEITGDGLQKVLLDMVDDMTSAIEDVTSNISSDIGDLSQLNTQNKSNIVEAINEISTSSLNLENGSGTNSIIQSGSTNKAGGFNSTVFGSQTIIDGSKRDNGGGNCFASGYNIYVDAYSSHAEGRHTRIEDGANGSHVEGYNNTISKTSDPQEVPYYPYSLDGCHAEGVGTLVKNSGGHAEGYKTISWGPYSHAEGFETKTTNEGEHAEGKYNKSNSNTIHSIGIGTSNTDRKNAIEVTTDGSVYIKGIGDYDGTNPTSTNTIQTVITNLSTALDGVDDLLRTLVYGE